MKAAAKTVRVRQPKSREHDEHPVARARDAVTFTDGRYRGQQLPLSCAPYRLQAADRWWRESCSAQADPRPKRHE